MEDHLADLLKPYKGQKGVTIQVLQKTQEQLGYLPREAIKKISRTLRISPSEIFGVISFYSQFRTTPRGKHVVRVCRGTACHVRGGGAVLDQVKRELGIEENETTPDLEYTTETVACIGACGLAPNMVVNKKTHGRLTVKKVYKILGHIHSKKKRNQGGKK